MKEELRQGIALMRYGAIAPLIAGLDKEYPSQSAFYEETAAKGITGPDGKVRHYAPAIIKKLILSTQSKSTSPVNHIIVIILPHYVQPWKGQTRKKMAVSNYPFCPYGADGRDNWILLCFVIPVQDKFTTTILLHYSKLTDIALH